jgi:predicted membrane chloride channel (bestrophin family)
MVLPYCVVNVTVYFIVTFLESHFHLHLDISSTGHSLMSLIIAYLGVSKVTLALQRYMNAKKTIGCAVLSLRELNQLAMILTENDKSEQAKAWREEVKVRVIAQIDITIRVIQDTDHANYLAMALVPNSGIITTDIQQDPMFIMLKLRSHLITASQDDKKLPNVRLQVLERMKMMDFLLQYSVAYRELLKIVSTPFPMALTQMARTFVFVWTFTIPFILSGGRVSRGSAVTFVILLTYGFLGLEFVAMMMSNPFGDDGLNDLNVPSIAKATILGIENDWRACEGCSNVSTDSIVGNSGVSSLFVTSPMQEAVSSRTLMSYERGTVAFEELQQQQLLQQDKDQQLQLQKQSGECTKSSKHDKFDIESSCFGGSLWL